MTEGFPILTAAEMRAAEHQAMAGGISVDTLMERAGAAIAEAVWRIAGGSDILILCGPGNNGGDGYVAARLLRQRGAQVRVAAFAPPKVEAASRAAALWDGPVEPLAGAKKAATVVDALFGTGLTRPLDTAIAEALTQLCRRAHRRVAADLPSGIATDDGAVLGDAPHCDLTIALGALKPSHRLLPAAEYCGQVTVADIGLGEIRAATRQIVRPRLAAPLHDANKYSRGKLLVLAGDMPGASLLAALAGQRAGAGYVELLGAEGDAPPHALVRRGWSAAAIEDERIAAIVAGPGLGRGRQARERLDAALAAGKPLVLDADALNLIGRARHDRLARHILTPHWGEFVRMFGDSKQDRLTQARAAARKSGAIVLLKGADSIVTHPDGRAAIASLAPSWLASAGTGDVLAGIVGGLLANGLEPFDAAQAGIWLHAEAARLCGPMLIADDLVSRLPTSIAACL